MDDRYDFIVIGAGPGGYPAAIQAARSGLKTAIIEEREAGGTCLNRGCIPTKALLHSAHIFREIQGCERFGLSAAGAAYDLDRIYNYKEETVVTLRNGVEALLKANGVDLIHGHATIFKDKCVRVSGAGDEGESRISAEHILIAAGGKPVRLPVPGADLPGILTSDEVLSCAPSVRGDGKRLLIIGGGVIGVEFATIFSSFGYSVTIVEALPSLLNGMDREISQNLKMLFRKRGIEVYTDSRVEEFKLAENAAELTGQPAEIRCRFLNKEKEVTVSADLVLTAVGRRPAADGLFAEDAAVVTDRGCLVINERFETNIPGVYAAGDVTGKCQLAHYATAQGIAAVRQICGEGTDGNLGTVPSCVYTDPEIASVGMTEEEVKKQGISYCVGKFLMGANGKSVITKEDRGFVKLIFEKDGGVLLGAHVMCARATDLIGELTSAVGTQSAAQIAETMRAHPTYYEAVTEAALDSMGGAIHGMARRKRI